MPQREGIDALTFDLFGTILNLRDSLTPHIQRFLEDHGSNLDLADMWSQYRARQRREQYQDTLLMAGHCGYLEAARRAFLWVLRFNKVPFRLEEVDRFMDSWKELRPFPDAIDGLNRLKGHYRLVVLSNGEEWFLDYLLKNQVIFAFDGVFSVQKAGAFKPHPAVYRACAQMLGKRPHELMMVSSNSFDVMGARASGYEGAWVDRYGLPYEETVYQPDLTVEDFHALADALLD